MPKPATVPTWATDAVFTDPGETWDGAANKVDPGAGKRANGWVPTETPGAEQFNFDKNLHGAWIAWLDTLFNSSDDHTYPTPKTRIIRVGMSAFQISGDTADYSLEPAITTGRPGILSVGAVGFVKARLHLNRYLPQGAVIDQIRVACTYDSTGTSPFIEMKLEEFRVSFSSWVATGLLSKDTTAQLAIKNSGGSARIILDSGAGLARSIIPTYQSVLLIQPNGIGQEVYEVEIVFSDLGLINI